MGTPVNLTSHRAGLTIGRDRDGRWQVVVVVKANYAWDDRGVVTLVEAGELSPVDQMEGDGAAAAVVHAAELGPPKPQVDVLVEGKLTWSRPITAVDVTLSIGEHISKTVRVMGERSWRVGVLGTAKPSEPEPVAQMPLTWTRSFGGVDPDEPSRLETRNPAGLGFARRHLSLAGLPVPNFEDPRAPITSASDRPAPHGFCALASHWDPRRGDGGTYDERWKAERAPLPPEDLDEAFFNVAPLDQRLPAYQPGMWVHLVQMTPRGDERFQLPAIEVPVTISTTEELTDDFVRVDTVVIHPALRRLSLLGRVVAPLRPNVLSLRHVVVGPTTPGLRRALELGKSHPLLRAPRAA